MSLVDVKPLVEVRDRENDADLVWTLIHEPTHCSTSTSTTILSARNAKSEAITYVVGATMDSIRAGQRSTSLRGSRTAEKLIEVLED